MRKKRNNYLQFSLILPQRAIDLIEANFQKGQGVKKDYLLICAYILYRHSIGGLKAQVSSRYLKNMLSSKYSTILKWLKSNNLATTDNHYIKATEGKAKCKSYALDVDYHDLGSVVVQFPKPIIGKTNTTSVSSVCPEDEEPTRIAFQNLCKFKIDAQKALKYLGNRQKGLVPKKEPLEATPLLSAVTGITNMINGYHYAKSCQYGRIHTQFTRLDKIIKETCVHHIEDKPLVHIDIRNAQPAILGAVLWKRMDSTNPKILKELTLYDKFCSSDLYHGLNLLNFKIQHPNAYDNEENQQVFEEKFKKELKEKDRRSKYKAEFIKMLYDRRTTGLKRGENEKIYLLFQKVFPNIYEEIKKIKEIDYKALAKMMQMFESRRILHPLIKYLDSKTVDFISIHDSVIIPNNEKDHVLKEFARLLEVNKIKTTLETTNIG